MAMDRRLCRPRWSRCTLASGLAALARFWLLRTWVFRPSYRSVRPRRGETAADHSVPPRPCRRTCPEEPDRDDHRPPRSNRWPPTRRRSNRWPRAPCSPPGTRGRPAVRAGPARGPGVGPARAAGPPRRRPPVLYLWDLSAQGWANGFYSAAVQAGTKSWKAFFFGSFDSSNFITVDKPPASLWVMELSARLFGLNSWSILVPQALEGVAAVGLLYVDGQAVVLARRRPARRRGPRAHAGGGAHVPLQQPRRRCSSSCSSSPPTRPCGRSSGRSTWWLVLAGTCVGFGFLTKMLQAFVVVPAIGLVYLRAGPPKLGRRIVQLLAGGVALVVAAGWWVAAVELTPAADRPYIGGSQDNSLFNLIFGYNGFGRITGNETGSVGGGGAGDVAVGPDRLEPDVQLTTFGTQTSWLIPAALVVLVAVLWLTRRAPRADRTRAAFILWGGWLLVTGAVFSFAQGIIHPYYTVALAPAIGALVGMGAVELWRRRHQWFARAALAGAIVLTAWWAFALLDRTPGWFSVAAVRRAGVGHRGGRRHPGRPAPRAQRPPGASRSSVSGRRWPARSPSPSTPWRPRSPAPSRRPARPAPAARSAASAAPGDGRRVAGRRRLHARRPGRRRGVHATGQASAPGPRRRSGPGAAGSAGGARAAGEARHERGLLNASAPSTALVKPLQARRGPLPWVAAAVGANTAAGYQLGTGDPVMAIGGFNGTDPDPTLATFETAGGRGQGPLLHRRWRLRRRVRGLRRRLRPSRRWLGDAGPRRDRWRSAGVGGLRRHHLLGRVPLHGQDGRWGHPL